MTKSHEPYNSPGTSSDAFSDALVAAIPKVRAFAIALSGDVSTADDLVQETLVKAWANMNSFTPGTNLRAWLFTILRNTFFSEHRKRYREVQDPDNQFSLALSAHPEQEAHMNFQDFLSAFAGLSPDQKEALILIGAEGFTYEEAAQICGCEVGTVKSRVNRARNRLRSLLEKSEENAGSQSNREPLAAVGTCNKPKS